MSSSVYSEDPRRALVAPNGPFAAVTVVSSTGSTNADLVAAAAGGAADRTVLIAQRQTEGRGRRSREWISPASGLYLSVLLRPVQVPVARLGTLAVVAGLALVRTARSAGVDATLKWPNDLLIGEAKAAGVLAEGLSGGTGVVVGIGLNVGPVDAPAGPGGLPATSLAEAGATTTDLPTLAATLLTTFAELESGWRSAGGDLEAAGLLAPYRAACATLGRRVRIELATGELTAEAIDIAPSAELVIKTDDGTETTVSAADVIHVRLH